MPLNITPLSQYESELLDEKKLLVARLRNEAKPYYHEEAFDTEDIVHLNRVLFGAAAANQLEMTNSNEDDFALHFKLSQFANFHFLRRHFWYLDLTSQLFGRLRAAPEHHVTPKIKHQYSLEDYINHLQKVERSRRALIDLGVPLEEEIAVDKKAGEIVNNSDFAFRSDYYAFDKPQEISDVLREIVQAIGKAVRP